MRHKHKWKKVRYYFNEEGEVCQTFGCGAKRVKPPWKKARR